MLNGESSQGVWKQTLGTDDYPKFSGGTVYSVNGQYTNTESVAKVEISWGTMEFTYTDGGWNTETHTYDAGGWTASGNTVTVTNTGTEAVKAMVGYENAAGYTFAADWSRKTAEIAVGANYTFTMNLSGKPTSALNNATIGTITVTLTDGGTPIGWAVENGNMNYYENGQSVLNQTKAIDGVAYTFGPDGVVVKGKTKLDGKWYRGDEFGLLKQGWVSATENGTTVYYYAKEDYSLDVNDTLEIGGVTYTFDANCRSDKAPSQ